MRRLRWRRHNYLINYVSMDLKIRYLNDFYDLNHCKRKDTMLSFQPLVIWHSNEDNRLVQGLYMNYKLPQEKRNH